MMNYEYKYFITNNLQYITYKRLDASLVNFTFLMSDTQKAYLYLHIAVFLWGFTAILGKLISISALPLVWWRILFTVLGLLFLLKGVSWLKSVPKRIVYQLMGIGLVITFHWLCFYGAIKLANASVALVCLTTTSLFTAIIEPMVLKKPFQKVEITLGIVIIPAMMLIVNDLDFKMVTGVMVGILAALGSGVFSVLNKTMVSKIAPLPMTFIELGSGLLALTLCLPIFYQFNPAETFIPSAIDIFYLLLLALICTILPFVLSLIALRKLSAFTTVLAVNLEPVYGIFMAWWLLHEDKELHNSFYMGVSIILTAVFLHPLLVKRFSAN